MADHNIPQQPAPVGTGIAPTTGTTPPAMAPVSPIAPPVPATPAEYTEGAQKADAIQAPRDAEAQKLREQMNTPVPPPDLRIQPQHASMLLPLMMGIAALSGSRTGTPMIGALSNMNAVMQAQLSSDKEITDHHEKEMMANYNAAMEAHKEQQAELKPLIQSLLSGSPDSQNNLRLKLLEQGVKGDVVDSIMNGNVHKNALDIYDANNKYAAAAQKEIDSMEKGRLDRESRERVAKLRASTGGSVVISPDLMKSYVARRKNGEPLSSILKGFGKNASAAGISIDDHTTQELMREGYTAEHAGSFLTKSGIEFAGDKSSYAALDKISLGQERIGEKVKLDIKNLKQLIPAGDVNGVKFVNIPINKIRSAMSSTDYAPFRLQAELVATEFEKQMAGSGLSIANLPVSAQENAHKLLNGDMSVAEIESILPTMYKDMENVTASNVSAKATGLKKYTPEAPNSHPSDIEALLKKY